MDALIKLLSRALAAAVKGKGKLIVAQANTKRASSYNKLTLIELRIESLERQLQTARDDLATATGCLNTSTASLQAAQDVQAHYDAHADEVLGFYPQHVRSNWNERH